MKLGKKFQEKRIFYVLYSVVFCLKWLFFVAFELHRFIYIMKLNLNLFLKLFLSQVLINYYISIDFTELSLIETICYEMISKLKTSG